MYGLPQAGQIVHNALVQDLAPYGYHQPRKIIGLCTHECHPINFTLFVDDFNVKYSGKEHALHLKVELDDK